MKNAKLEAYLATSMDDLPAIPDNTSLVLKALDDPDSSGDQVQNLVKQDPALSAQLLKASNSAFYGLSREIRGVGHAISILGRRTVRNLVFSASMKGTYKQFGLMEKLLWEHSVMAGPVTSRLARVPGIDIDPEEAFSAGLLHDIGKTALANSHRDEYQQIVATVYNERRPFVQVEEEFFGFDHTELGARVAQKWKLPTSLTSVIRYHHDPKQLNELPEDVARLTALTTIATACLTRLGVGRREPCEQLDLPSLPAWHFLSLEEDHVQVFLDATAEQVEANSSLVGESA